MRILWVKMGGLWPSTSGGRVRSLRIIGELSRRHRVTVITTHGPDEDPKGLALHLSLCNSVMSIPYVVPKKESATFPAAVARSWLSPYPVDLWKWCVPAVRDEVRRLMAANAVDLCIADFLCAVANVPLGGAVPVVLFQHNVEHLIWRRLSELERKPWRRMLFEIEWRKLRRREAEACAGSDLTIAVSEQDGHRLASLAPGARVSPIPTGVDTTYFVPDGTAQLPARLVFTGSMDWHPNEDAVLYFIDAILPRIRSEVPHASFAVVGRNPSDRLRTAGERSGVLITGTVDDVRPFVREAAVYVVPLRAGGGTRLKIFEALSLGKAVVSTTVGAEGLALASGRDAVIADGPADFASAVVSLLRDPRRREALGTAGRRLVESRYTWTHVASEFETLCIDAFVHHAQSRTRASRRVDLSQERPCTIDRARLLDGERIPSGRLHRHS
jgi:glycosyltransferase involved in cell wall biosynthesis